ncbi:MAG: patatin-like phospholipase family protein, partial [Sphingobium sp.]
PAADPAVPPPPAASPPGMARTRRPAVPLPVAANDNEPPGDSMDAVLRQAFRPPDTATQPARPQYSEALILSGGGQWGAYGAGLLTGWSIHGRLPARIVTGISTGALQATFAYLGEDKRLIEAYSITDERQLAIRYGNGFFLRHASTADIAPLKSYVRAHVGPLIPAVAAEYRQSGRKLLVGAVDGLSGRFHIIDLTQIADDAELTEAQKLDCYSAGLMASAAVPVIFRQVSINGRPWLDGGVRHAVFLPDIIRRIGAAHAAEGERAVRTDGTVWAIKNGVTSIEEFPALPAKLLPTILRLRTIVFDELETNSLDLAAYQASRQGLKLYAATADGWDMSGLPECRDVRPGVEDMIFDPAFMRCLLSYGEGQWLNGRTPWVLHDPR